MDKKITAKAIFTKYIGASVAGVPEFLVMLMSDIGQIHIARTRPNDELAYEVSTSRFRDTFHEWNLDFLGNVNSIKVL